MIKVERLAVPDSPLPTKDLARNPIIIFGIVGPTSTLYG
jgi:hypothetical protein